jgi:hypothetical protein
VFNVKCVGGVVDGFRLAIDTWNDDDGWRK